jgi:hypothetical protein
MAFLLLGIAGVVLLLRRFVIGGSGGLRKAPSAADGFRGGGDGFDVSGVRGGAFDDALAGQRFEKGFHGSADGPGDRLGDGPEADVDVLAALRDDEAHGGLVGARFIEADMHAGDLTGRERAGWDFSDGSGLFAGCLLWRGEGVGNLRMSLRRGVGSCEDWFRSQKRGLDGLRRAMLFSGLGILPGLILAMGIRRCVLVSRAWPCGRG